MTNISYVSIQEDTMLLEASTPEEFFTPNPNIQHSLQIDAVTCAIDRARAVLLLLGNDAHAGCVVDHHTIGNAIWCVDGLLQQIEMIVCRKGGICQES
jgi:hypothetical protein